MPRTHCVYCGASTSNGSPACPQHRDLIHFDPSHTTPQQLLQLMRPAPASRPA